MKVKFDEELYRSFQELVKDYTSKTNNVSATLTVIATALTTIAAPYLVAIPAISGPYVFPSIVRSIWKRLGPNNWVFLILSFSKRR